jgi:very-short-patch-repair endonuclease
LSASYRGSYRVGRAIAKEINKKVKHQMNFNDIQRQAKSRPESVPVDTPQGTIWLSPIEFQLYEEMRRNGLLPFLQYCIEGYFVDFAFPDVRVAVEADGAEYHSEERYAHDRKRDWVIQRAGWKIMHFKGSTIFQKSGNCAYVINKEVEGRRAQTKARAKQKEIERQERRDALLRPFKWVANLVMRDKR